MLSADFADCMLTVKRHHLQQMFQWLMIEEGKKKTNYKMFDNLSRYFGYG